jgi:hypothetical protein
MFEEEQIKTMYHFKSIMVLGGLFLILQSFTGCATTSSDVAKWERTGNTAKLSEVTRNKEESPTIRKLSMESLARLNWKPSNEERLQVFSLFASKGGYVEATALMQTVTAEQFAEIDKQVVACASLVTRAGGWTDTSLGKVRYNELSAIDGKVVKISLCQQVLAHPEIQTSIVLLAIKLGISGSENELNGILFVYGNKFMAEDYLNSGSSILNDGGYRWAHAHGYKIQKGYGSHRSNWGKF